MPKIRLIPSRPAPAASAVSSRAFLYRFGFSCCLCIFVLFACILKSSSLTVFILTFIDLAFCADILIVSAVKDILNGRMSFALLISGSSLAGFAYSAYNTFSAVPWECPYADLYLYTVLLVTVALWAQLRLARARERGRIFVKKIDDFLPKSARVCRGKKEYIIFSGEVKKGDLILVKAGERIAADGKIENGTSTIDEQLITGNILPSFKGKGDRVYAGTLNKTHAVYVRVDEVLQSSALMEILAAVKAGELRKSDVKSPLDSQSGWLILGVIAIAALMYGYIVWKEIAVPYMGLFLFSVALACPVVLPFAILFPVYWMRKGARREKIIIQNPYALQTVCGADLFFFDKTGTLTNGELTVCGLYPVSKKQERTLAGYLVTAEQFVSGPFSKAAKNLSQQYQVEPQSVNRFEVFPGKGVCVRRTKEVILAGSFPWLCEYGKIKVPAVPNEGQAVIGVAVNKRFIGYITLKDHLRQRVKETISFLQMRGKETVLLSGDNEQAVAAVSQQAGIKQFSFNVLPKTKAEIITNFRTLGKTTVMTGDGFNDILALLKADCSIVYASGQNVYHHWTDVILYRKDLYPLADLFTINKRLNRVIFQNLTGVILLHGLWIACLVLQLSVTVNTLNPVFISLVLILMVLLNSMRMLHIR